MRTKLLIGSALAVVLVVVTAAFAGVFTTAKPAAAQEPIKTVQVAKETQPCCTLEDCCQDCIDCCAEDGCCWECILCCIEMGCDPSCCFPDASSVKAEAPKTSEACCADAKGCCAKPAPKKATGCCADGCCK